MSEGTDCRGHGQTTLAGATLALLRSVDRTFLEWAIQRGAQEYQFPNLIPATELAKTDYLRSFPHLATFPVALDANASNLEAFANGERVSVAGDVQVTKLASPQYVLTPAACYHFYIHLQGQDLAAPRYLTTCATCFRREASYRPFERQWAFSMRELVCIGSRAEVVSFIEEMRETIDRFMSSIALPAVWAEATDAFFQPKTSPQWWLQRLEPNKTELLFGQGLAIASINFHRSYFGERFLITRDGERAFSGCVAFGLERWLSATLRHYGDDPASWPAAWRA